MTEPAPRKSDLGVRVVSAVVMVAVAGTALWLGGWFWGSFVALVTLGAFIEWSRLTMTFARSGFARIAWHLAGGFYIGMSAVVIVVLRWDPFGLGPLAVILATVIAVDVGAYLFGRTFGGPKIAPSISPSKTWSGLGGGIVGAAIVMLVTIGLLADSSVSLPDTAVALGVAALAAIVAQVGDFFESWMKRRAGVKDSGKLLPGHGGLLDRLDGLLAVLFVLALFSGIISLLTPRQPTHVENFYLGHT